MCALLIFLGDFFFESFYFVDANRVWIAVGASSVATPSLTIQMSDDGMVWVPVPGAAFSQSGTGIVEGGSPLKVVAVGRTSSIILLSSNISSGFSSPVSVAGPTGYATGVSYRPDDFRFVVGSEGGSKFSNDNGASWSQASNPSPACNDIAVRVSPTLYVSGGSITPGVVNGSVIVQGSATVNGNLTVQGTLNVNGTLIVSPGVTVTSTTLIVGGVLSTSSSSLLNTSSLVIGPNATLVVSPPVAPSGLLVSTVVSYATVNGAFASVLVASSCSVSPTYGSSSLTVTINFSCGGELR
jgi:hypothetical protein